MKVVALHPDVVMESVVVIPSCSRPLLGHLKTLGAIDQVFHNSVRLSFFSFFNADRKGSSLSFKGTAFVADLQFERTFIKSPEGKIFSPSAHIAFEFRFIGDREPFTRAVLTYG